MYFKLGKLLIVKLLSKIETCFLSSTTWISSVFLSGYLLFSHSWAVIILFSSLSLVYFRFSFPNFLVLLLVPISIIVFIFLGSTNEFSEVIFRKKLVSF